MKTPNINPTDWHKMPRGYRGRCPICGCPTTIGVSFEHRLVDPSEGLAVKWIFRTRNGATTEWVYRSILKRKPPRPRGRWPKPRPRMDSLVTDATMHLRTLLEKCVAADWLADRAHSTLVSYRATVSQFARFLKHEPLVGDLRADVFLPFYVFCFQRGQYRRTIITYRQHLLSLWRYAAAVGILAEPPEVVAVPEANVSIELTDAPAPPDTLRHYYQHVLKPRFAPLVKATTIVQYDACVRSFFMFCGGDVPLEAVTDAKVKDFYRWVVEVRGNTHWLADKHTLCIRRILRHWRPAEFARPPAANKIFEGEPVEMSIRWYFDNRYLPSHDLRPATQSWYRIILRRFGEWLGREAMLADLTRETVNKYLMAMQEFRPPRYAKDLGRVLLTIWRAAYDEDLIELAPRGIRKIKVPPILPTAWGRPEVRRLLDATRKSEFDRRLRNGLRLGDFFDGLIRLGYDTALRFGDMEALTWASVHDDGTIVIAMSKTGFPHVCGIRAETMAALLVIRVEGDDRVLPWPSNRRRFYPLWRKLVAAAGLEVGRRNGPQRLRRTSATHVEAMTPGAATAHLGHRSGDLARRHYLDPTLCHKASLPPAVPDAPLLLEGPTDREIGGAA